jgi:hypothetical protein
MTAAGRLALPVTAMAAVVIASNVLVQYPFTPGGLQDLLTWGAFTYPLAFFVTDLTNRRFGPGRARQVVIVGFAMAVALSAVLATPRIAVASGTAFLAAQLLDVAVFDRLRARAWWLAPIASSVLGSLLDTALFFTLAFAASLSVLGANDDFAIAGAPLLGVLGTEAPRWVSWAVGDLGVKLAVALALLLPFGALLRIIPARESLGAAES